MNDFGDESYALTNHQRASETLLVPKFMENGVFGNLARPYRSLRNPDFEVIGEWTELRVIRLSEDQFQMNRIFVTDAESSNSLIANVYFSSSYSRALK